MDPGDTGQSSCGDRPVPQQCRKLRRQLLVLLSNGDLTVHFSPCRGAGAANSQRKCICQAARMGGCWSWVKHRSLLFQYLWQVLYSLGEQCDFFGCFVVPEVRGGIFLVSTTRKHCNRFSIITYPWKYLLAYKTFLLPVLVAVIRLPELLWHTTICCHLISCNLLLKFTLIECQGCLI